MATPLSLTAVYEPVGDGWVQARIQELPGVITAGRTMDEAKAMLEDALREYILAQMNDGSPEDTAAGTQRTPLELKISA